MEVPGVAGVVLVGLVYIHVSKATTCYKYDDVTSLTYAFQFFGWRCLLWYGGHQELLAIIGIVVGSVVGVIILIIIIVTIVCLVKHCNKRSQKGAVIKPYPGTSGGDGAVSTQPQPHKAGPGTRLPPLIHNYTIPPTHTLGVPSTLNNQKHTVPPITSGPDDVPPPFIYIPPYHARRH
ncbi:uncharacterized protein [Argopecten irradians]|uniref:uncharacterized protein n=1 Tax=Argopecten irradians TaxID=31199 RepID=UPI00371DD39C